MNGLIAWGGGTLLASTLLMALVLAIRAPVRRWLGPGLGYGLWALPALRMLLPPLPWPGALAERASQAGMAVLFAGPRAVPGPVVDAGRVPVVAIIAAIWLVGALGLLGLHALRHLRFCARARREGKLIDTIHRVPVIATDVDGPLAFGVLHRVIAVPRDFTQAFDPAERALVLAHEAAHHARGDLLANWLSLGVLAAHWWNPLAWAAIRAFHEDQELAVDAQVLRGRGPAARPVYAHALVKAAGVGAPCICPLTTRSTLKGRLTMLAQKPRSTQRLALGGWSLSLLGGAALLATGAAAGQPGAAGRQAVTIGVQPDGSGGFSLIVDGRRSAAGAPLAAGMTLPAGFSRAGHCSLARDASPMAMVVKGTGGTQTYTVMCASAGSAPVHATLVEGLASLRTMRASVAVQESPTFPPAERAHALGAIDRSIREVEARLQHAS